MIEKEEQEHSQADKETTPLSPSGSANQPETRSRRELIERYGKYALVGAPLLLFVSKAHAIHSRP